MRTLQRLSILFSLSLLSIGLLFTGCSKHHLQLPLNTPAAADLVKDSAQQLQSLSSVHLDIQALGNTDNSGLIFLYGDITEKPKLAAQGHLKAKYDGIVMEGDIRIVDDVLYANHIFGPRWLVLGRISDFAKKYRAAEIFGVDDNGVLQLLAFTGKILNSVTDLKSLGVEKINGIVTEKISGVISAQEIAQLYPKMKDSIPVEMWIEANGDHRLVRSVLQITDNSSSQLTLSEWNKPVNVVKPID